MSVSKIDINDYSAQEIFDMLKLRKPTKDMFLKKVMDLLNKAKDKVTKQFLLDAKGLVLTSYFNIQDIDDYSQGEDEDEILLQNIYNSQQIDNKKKQTEERIIHIDSKYRSGVKLLGKLFSKPNGKNEFLLNPNDPASPTSFLLSFENPLLNVVSMRVNTLQVPISWHTYDHCYGNTYFWIDWKQHDKLVLGKSLFCVIYPWTYTDAKALVREMEYRVGLVILETLESTKNINLFGLILQNMGWEPKKEEDEGKLLNLLEYLKRDQGRTKLTNIYNGDVFPPPTSATDSNGSEILLLIKAIEKIIKFEVKYGTINVTVAKEWSLIFHSSDTVSFINPPPPDKHSKMVPYGKIFVNHNLGWYLGFRDITPDGSLIINSRVDNSGNLIATNAIVAPNLNGTKTLFISIDDHTRNYSNTSFTNILQLKTKNSLPGYYSKSSHMITNDETSKVGYLQRQVPKDKDAAQKNLTLNQVYAANEILSSIRETDIEDFMLPTPVLSGELAVIPLENMAKLRMPNMQIKMAHFITQIAKQNSMSEITKLDDTINKQSVVTDAQASLPEFTNEIENAFSPSTLLNVYSNEIVNNVRLYKKPVTLERIGVKLCDENGYLLNLNGYDWNFTLKFEQEIYS